jgi:pre-mRNA-processing factor 40
MLRRANVQPDWTWEQTLHATVKDPQFRAVKDPKDRKTAFEKYVMEVRIQEKDKAKERLAKLRSDFATMLRSHREIKHYTRWKTARSIIEHEAIFRSTDNETERRQLFEEYITDLKKTNVEREVVTRKNAMDELVVILKALDLEPYTRWSEAHAIIQSHERFASDEKFKTLSKSDVLTAFENHIKSLERTFNDERQREKASKARKERQNRDRFIDLLKEFKAAGKIKAGTKWKKIHSEIESDTRYIGILGQPGSSPLDLFRDMVEEEERGLRLVRNDVYDVLEDRRYEVTPKTTFQDFQSIMQSDRRTGSIPQDTLSLLFERLLEKVNRRSDEDKHATERHTRRAIDALRSRIKHLENPAIQASSTWESVRPQIVDTDEFKALESDDLRRQAFDKVIRRLKEKDEDLERERERKREYRDRDRDRDRDYRDRDRERDRERDRRRARASRTRSPEPDAYEADRRKAMADRERVYRKAGPATLTPPPRDRERDRHSREGRLGGYEDRERDGHRDRRDDERERLYRVRADPRGARDELDYGGTGIGAGSSSSARRRRGDSEGAESVGSRKRARREKSKEKEVDVKKEEVAMHSGSEEGEMVEE